MAKCAPSGFGVWAAYPGRIGGVDAFVAAVVKSGAKWVAPRIATGKMRDGYWTSATAREATEKFHAAGIKVYPWVYSYPNTCLVEVAWFKAAQDEGADGVFIDAEIEYEQGDHAAQAELFMVSLRKAVGEDFFVGHAPFAYPLWHSGFPYEVFGKYCDAVADQLYWTEFNDQGAQHHIDATTAQWKSHDAAFPKIARPRHPIGVSYGNELKGIKNPPPGKLKRADVDTFLDWCEKSGFEAYSLYSIEAACPEAWDAMVARVPGTPEVAPGKDDIVTQIPAPEQPERVLPEPPDDPPEEPGWFSKIISSFTKG